MIVSFYNGWRMVPQCKINEIREKIKDVLKIKSDVAWQNYLYARTEVSRSEAIEIEKIFKELNIKEIWGNKK